MGHFFFLGLEFWSPRAAFLRTWITTLVVLGSKETPKGHTESLMSVFNDFWLDLGTLLEHILWSILWFPVIWGGEPGESFQVHVFDASRMEMMRQNAVFECVITTVKTMWFEWFHFFYLFSKSGSRRWDLANTFMPFGRSWFTFSYVVGSWRQVWNLVIFDGFLGGQGWGNKAKWM